MSRLLVGLLVLVLSFTRFDSAALAASAKDDQLKAEYEKALAALKEDDETGCFQLATWCQSNRLVNEAAELSERGCTIMLGKKHAELNKKTTLAGYKQLISWCLANKLNAQMNELNREMLLFDYGERKAKLQSGDVKGWLALAAWCRTNKLAELTKQALKMVIEAQPGHAEARAELGFVKLDGQWLDREAQAQMYVSAKAEERAATFESLKKAGFKGAQADLDRYVAWSEGPTGLLKRQKVPGYTEDNAWYHISVPAAYGVFKEPLPILIVLHGAPGPNTGSGDMLVALAQNVNGLKNCISVFPTHLQREWSHPSEMKYLFATIEEVLKRWRADPRRIYLMGHSMGGYGAWSFGAAFPELFAALSPVSGHVQDLAALNKLVSKPVYILQGLKDSSMLLENGRKACAQLKKQGANVVLREADCGHMPPPDEFEKDVAWLMQYENQSEYDLGELKTRVEKLVKNAVAGH